MTGICDVSKSVVTGVCDGPEYEVTEVCDVSESVYISDWSL